MSSGVWEPREEDEGFESELAVDLRSAMAVNDATPPECWDPYYYNKAAEELKAQGYVKVTICKDCRLWWRNSEVLGTNTTCNLCTEPDVFCSAGEKMSWEEVKKIKEIEAPGLDFNTWNKKRLETLMREYRKEKE